MSSECGLFDPIEEASLVELGPHRSLSRRASSQDYIPGLFELDRIERLPVGTGTTLIGRDPYVAELSMKLDRFQADLKALRRDLDLAKGDMAELREETERSTRLHSFQEKEQRARALKLEEMQRRLSEVKGRLDHFTSFGSGDFVAFNSFESVSRKLTELSSMERTFKEMEKKLKLSAGLFCGSLLLWLLAVFAL